LHYGVEETNDVVKIAKYLWKQAEKEYLEAVENQSKKLKCEQKYNEYINALTSALDAEREVV
jgi:hypothetical protein